MDEVWIEVIGGQGGNGAATFRREKYVPMGGPDGGDGGNGGGIYLWADPTRHSFMDLRYRRHLKADKGSNGQGSRKNGRKGEDLLVPVPLGTIIKDEEGNILADLTIPHQKVLVAAGGVGGRGNRSFTSSRRRAPRLAENGAPGEERRIYLELKLMAQVGLVGFPNAGKSTFLSRISAARPKVASYPFTTLKPNLGVVELGDGEGFVVADLPGLIEGAHQGAGLGHRFLRHVERTLILLIVIDLSPQAEPEPVQAYRQLVQELASYSEDLATYPRVLAGNKLDVTGSEKNLELLRQAAGEDKNTSPEVFGISAVTGDGVKQLVRFLAQEVSRLNKEELPGEEVIYPEISAGPVEQPGVVVEKENGVYLVRGARIERFAAQTDFENEESLRRFQVYCRRSGLEAKLRKMGISEGDTVRIGKEEFYYYDKP